MMGYRSWPGACTWSPAASCNAGTATTNHNLDLDGDGIALVAYNQRTDVAITHVHTSLTAVTSPPVYRFSLQGVAARAPDGTIKGVGNTAKVDFTPLTTGLQRLALDTPYRSSSPEVLALVVGYLSGTIGAGNLVTIRARSQATLGLPLHPYTAIQTAGTWAVAVGYPCQTWEYADGTMLPDTWVVKADPAASAYNSGSPTPFDAMRFVPPESCLFSGCWGIVNPSGDAADFVLELYEGDTSTTPVSSRTIDADVDCVVSAGARIAPWRMPRRFLSGGTPYYICARPLTANNITVFNLDAADPTNRPSFCGNMHRAIAAAAGSWTLRPGQSMGLIPLLEEIRSFDVRRLRG